MPNLHKNLFRKRDTFYIKVKVKLLVYLLLNLICFPNNFGLNAQGQPLSCLAIKHASLY